MGQEIETTRPGSRSKSDTAAGSDPMGRLSGGRLRFIFPFPDGETKLETQVPQCLVKLPRRPRRPRPVLFLPYLNLNMPPTSCLRASASAVLLPGMPFPLLSPGDGGPRPASSPHLQTPNISLSPSSGSAS